MTVRDIAETDVVTADRHTELADIVGRMSSEDVGSVLIKDEDELVGLVTDRQIALSLADDPDASGRTAGDVMTEDPVTVGPDAGLFEVIQRMEDAGIRRIPVTEAGRVEGIVTLDDVLVVLSEEMDSAAGVIEKQSPRC